MSGDSKPRPDPADVHRIEFDFDEGAQAPAPSLDDVFAGFRQDAVRRSGVSAEVELARGMAMFVAGQVAQAIVPLEAAARSPHFRFAAASQLARIHRDRGQVQESVEWYERAAEAPSTDPMENRQVLYELAELLEGSGETARALAVYLELLTEAGDYRDARSRADRLSNAQARG